MKHHSKFSIKTVLLLSACFLLTCRLHAEQPPMKLWYNHPATNWMTSALPIGNGELGGMFFGGVKREQIQFNEKHSGQEVRRSGELIRISGICISTFRGTALLQTIAESFVWTMLLAK